MKRMGVLGGISAQATIDFEARVHRAAQRLVPQDWNRGYPPMVVWYHRELPLHWDADGRPLGIHPGLVEAATRLGPLVDFLVVPCNSAHLGIGELRAAAGRPVLSMIDVALHEVTRRGCRRVGVLGARRAVPAYLDGLRAHRVGTEEIDATLQQPLDAGIQAVMEGREGKDDRDAALAAIGALRARGVDAVLLGCTEIPLMLGDDSDAPDLLHPAALLADAAVRFALAP
jgi:aspartate racemase